MGEPFFGVGSLKKDYQWKTFQQFVRAFDTLSSPLRRALYDYELLGNGEKKKKRKRPSRYFSKCVRTKIAEGDESSSPTKLFDDGASSTTSSRDTAQTIVESVVGDLLKGLRKRTMTLSKDTQREELERLSPLAQKTLIDFCCQQKAVEMKKEEKVRALENGEASSSDEESSGSSTDDDEDVQCKPVGPSIGRSVKNGQTSFSVSTMLDNICVELDGGDDLQFAVDMHLLLAEIRTRCEPQLANAQKTKPKLHRNVSFIKDFYFDEQANEALDSVLKEAGISRDLLQLRFHVKVDAKQWLKESVCLPVTNRFEEVLKLRQLFSNATTQGLEVFRSLCISK